MMAQRKQSRAKVLKKFSASISDLLNISKKSEQTCNSTFERKYREPYSKSNSALHYSASLGKITVLKMLLQNGAFDINGQDEKGRTPLHCAISHNSMETISALLNNGADPNVCDFDGISPMHLACKDGMIDTLNLLLYYRSVPFCKNNEGKTPFDLACEFGRFKTVAHLLTRNFSRHFLSLLHSQSGFHYAARQGHLLVVTLLVVDHHWPIDHQLPGGTALHQAAGNGWLEIVRFLIHAGAQTYLTNATGQTALDLVRKNAKRNYSTNKEIRYLLKESTNFVYSRAVFEFAGVSSDELSFSCGDLIWVIERVDSKRWKGVIFGPRFNSRSGYFPPSAVKLIERPAFSMSRSVSHRQIKKVAVPTVPDVKDQMQLSFRPQNDHQQSNGNGTVCTANCTTANGNGSTNVHCRTKRFPLHQQLLPSSPQNRTSTGSNSSQTSSGFESMKSSIQSSTSTMTTTNQTFLGDNPASRNSVHSSSSGSLGSGSLEQLDESHCTSMVQFNLVDLLARGMDETEILAVWLHHLHFDDYLPQFLNHGYDISTISRMTPEDLTAIGVTKPGHRKRLTTEIQLWSNRVVDRWPTVAPKGGLREWLSAVGLPDYIPLFESQGYLHLNDVVQLTWEDFDDLGIRRLGHLKRLDLAIRKLKDSGALASNSITPCKRTVFIKPFNHEPSLIADNEMNSFKRAGDLCGTFPRRNNQQLVVTEATVHQSAIDDKPMIQVRPLLKNSVSQEMLCIDNDDSAKWMDKSAIRLNLHCPGRILSDQFAENELQRQTSFPGCFNGYGDVYVDDSTPRGGDFSHDYPPPPAPIVCEPSIRRLRTVLSTPERNKMGDSFIYNHFPQPSTSNNGSTDTLPFANENCGTIRSRNGESQSESSTNLRRDSEKSDALNDIGHMLQNLTAELDTMLCPRSEQSM